MQDVKQQPEFERLQRRISKNLLAKVTTSTREFFGFVRDISKTGMAMGCNRNLDLGETLNITLNMPDARTVEMTGRVVWKREQSSLSKNHYQIGVRITQAPEEFHRHVENLLSREYERRAHRRFPDAIPVSSKDVLDLMDATTGDVSAGGLYIRTSKALKVEGQYDLSLTVPDEHDEPIVVLAEVVTSFETDPEDGDHPYGAGVKFISFAGNGRERFGDYLRSLEEIYKFHWPEELEIGID